MSSGVSSTAPEVLAGAEAWAHTTPHDGAAGVLVLHGFTGNPSSVRQLAGAFAAADLHVELPRLPGHGTTVEDMMTTSWSDWTGEVERAYERLVDRAASVVVAGLSMGGSLALWTAGQHPEVRGLVLVNPATQPQPADVRAMLQEWLDDGTQIVPGVGSDLADPDVTEIAYEGTPLRCLISFLDDGLTPLSTSYGELTAPLLLFTSRQDHVVEPSQSEYLAERYGGPVDHRWLDRSYHVATQDFDRDVISLAAVGFAREVTA